MAGEISYTDPDPTMAANSDHFVPSQKAMRSSQDTQDTQDIEISAKADGASTSAALALKADTSAMTTALALKASAAALASGLATKEPSVASGTVDQYYQGDKTWQPKIMSKIYMGGVLQSGIVMASIDAVVATGTLTFWTTDNGLSTGNTIFPNTVFASTIQILPVGSTGQVYEIGPPTVSVDRKKITCSVTQTNSALLALLLNFVTVPNGVKFNLSVLGN